MRRRLPVTLALPTVAIVGLLATSLLAAPAVAADDAASLDLALDGSGSSELFLQYRDSTAATLAISAGTTTIAITTETPATADTVQCRLVSGADDSTLLEVPFSAAQWDSGTVSFGTASVDTTAVIAVRCMSTDATGASWDISWVLSPSADAIPTVTLSQDDPLWSESRSRHLNHPISPVMLRPGQAVTVTGPDGTWREGDNSYVRLEGTTGPFVDAFLAYALSDDLSTLSFTIPQDLDPRLLDTAVILDVQTSILESYPDGTSFFDSVQWGADAQVDTAITVSTTRLNLSTPYALSFLPTRVSAAVSAAETLTGTVTFTVDSVVVRTVPLTPSTRGRVSAWLPPLPRGKHVIVATYSGSTDVAASHSSPDQLRVVF